MKKRTSLDKVFVFTIGATERDASTGDKTKRTPLWVFVLFPNGAC